MFSFYKWDIAISAAEEDFAVVDLIAPELDKRKISYYDYRKYIARNWGEHILKITSATYGRRSKYVLMITSEAFARKYWANIEKDVALIRKPLKRPYILQLKLDDTSIDGIAKHVIFEKWKNNPGEIADMIQEKLKKRPPFTFPVPLPSDLFWIKAASLTLLLSVFGYSFFTRIPSNVGEQTKTSSQTPGETIESKSNSGNAVSPRVPIQIETVSIDAASFLMGTEDKQTTPAPIHKVNLSPYKISKTEITVAQFRQFCKETGHQMPNQPPYPVPDSSPVVNVSWYDADSFCKWMGGRLPTEAEWEFAAGHGRQEKYGETNNIAFVAKRNLKKASKVAALTFNSFGIYDMIGNVSEWCSDWYQSTYFPADSIDPKGPDRGIEKVIKGGSFESQIKPVNEFHIAFRSKELPDIRKPTLGFRAAWDQKPTK